MADDGSSIDEVTIMKMMVIVVSVAKVCTIISGLVCCRRDQAAPGSLNSQPNSISLETGGLPS